MRTWIIAGALIVAGALLAGPVFAQTTAPGAAQDKAKSGTGAESSGAVKPDSMKSDSAAKAGASGRMAGGKREQVKAAQQALKDKGHDPGPVDGMMGPKTQAAVKEFQSKEGLSATGQLDTETMSKLGVQAKAGASADTGGSPSASPSASGSSGPSTGSGGRK